MEIETRLANKKVLIGLAKRLKLNWIRTYAERRRTMYTVKFYLMFTDGNQDQIRVLWNTAQNLGSYEVNVKDEKKYANPVQSITFYFKYNNPERRI